MSALVGALRAMLTLDSTAFVAGGDKAIRTSKRIQASMSPLRKTMLGVAVVMGTLSAGLALSIKGSLNAADEMGKAAQKFGLPVEQLSRLKYAADLSDVSLETLGVSLGQLSKKMVAAAGGSKAQIALFDAMGVSVTDANGKLRATEDVLQDVAAKFAAMADGPEKTAMAIKLFGKAGAEMIPLLNAGKTGLQAMAEEANKLGIVIDAKTAKSAEAFNDNLTRLKAAMGGLVVQITSALAPTLERLSAFAITVTDSFGKLSPETKEMVIQMAAVFGAVALAAASFTALSFVLSPVGVAIAAIAAAAFTIKENWGPISAWFSEQWTSIKTSTEEAWASVKASIGGAIDYVQGKWDAFVGTIQAAVDKVKAAGRAIDEAIRGSAAERAATYDRVQSDTAAGAFNTSNMGGSNSRATGRSTADGVVEGYKERLAERISEIAAATETIVTAVRSQLGVRSPSTVMREVGQHTTEGLALGIKDNVPMVQSAMAAVGDALTAKASGLKSALDDFKSTAQSAFAGFVTQTMKWRDALSQVITKLAQMLANKAFEGLMAGGGDGLLGGLLKAIGFADGAAFSGGRVTAFASGGVVSGATAFGMQSGLGIMGEAGPEAIMPLTRGAGGKLGVQASGGTQRVQIEITENEMFASRVSTIADERSVQVVRRYDRDVAPQSRQRAARERG